MFRPIPGKSDSFEVKEPIYYLKDDIRCPKKAREKLWNMTDFQIFYLLTTNTLGTPTQRYYQHL